MKLSNFVFISLTLVTCIFCMACGNVGGVMFGGLDDLISSSTPSSDWSTPDPGKSSSAKKEGKYSGTSTSDLYQMRNSTESKISDLKQMKEIAEMTSASNLSDIKSDLQSQQSKLAEINKELSSR